MTLRVTPPAHPETMPRQVAWMREVEEHAVEQRAGEAVKRTFFISLGRPRRKGGGEGWGGTQPLGDSVSELTEGGEIRKIKLGMKPRLGSTQPCTALSLERRCGHTSWVQVALHCAGEGHGAHAILARAHWL